MYSLFLFTSLLSFLALLAAAGRRRPAPLRALGGRARSRAREPSLRGARRRRAGAVRSAPAPSPARLVRLTLAAVGVVGIPFWWADIVLRDRFDVGVGGGGPRLGSPGSVLRLLLVGLRRLQRGHTAPGRRPVLLLALVGAVLLCASPARVGAVDRVRDRRARARVHARDAALDDVTGGTAPDLRAAVLQRPASALPLVEPRDGTTRRCGRRRSPSSSSLVGEVRWANQKTPPLFDGDPAGRNRVRATPQRPGLPRQVVPTTSCSATSPSSSVPGNRTAPSRPRASRVRTLRSSRRTRRTSTRAARTRRLGARRERHDEREAAADDPVRASRSRSPPSRRRVYGPYLVIRSRRPLVTRSALRRGVGDVMRLGRALRDRRRGHQPADDRSRAKSRL